MSDLKPYQAHSHRIHGACCDHPDLEEAFAAIDSAAKLIATMRNNKKATLWLKKYGPAEAGDHR